MREPALATSTWAVWSVTWCFVCGRPAMHVQGLGCEGQHLLEARGLCVVWWGMREKLSDTTAAKGAALILSKALHSGSHAVTNALR